MKTIPSGTTTIDNPLDGALILLADDEEIVRTVVRLTLESRGACLLEADNGSKALEMAREGLPDVAILDWMMPGMSGVDVVKALKADSRASSVRSILLTANGERSHFERGHRAGVHAYLVKPFSPGELISIVESTLRVAPCPRHGRQSSLPRELGPTPTSLPTPARSSQVRSA